MKKQTKTLAPEWSFPVEAEKVGANAMEITIQPNAEERKLLAQRLGLKTLESLKADLILTRAPGKATIHVTGLFTAQVKQECVVTGKPLTSDISEDFEAWFSDREKAVPLARARKEKDVQKGKVEMPVTDESEDPEPVVDGKIDAGELVTQYLSLSINPYPRAEGVVYGEAEDALPQARMDNPFAMLKQWKSRKSKD